MIYNETKAKRLVTQHSLSPGLIALWKFRNKIPDIYFKKDFTKKEKLNEHDTMLFPKVIKVISCGKINLSYLSNLTGLPISEYKLGKSTPNSLQLKALVNWLTGLSNQINAVSESLAKYPNGDNTKLLLRTLLEDRKIYVYVLVARDRITYNKIEWFIKSNSINQTIVPKLISALLVFIDELEIV